ncbi:MAG: hypothetical protein B7X58_04345 [Marinobacter sp. 34-60-7]|nr:MAG: hypothetical protein B7X58_04345 [Marinobacter sp. 34-60-7]
MKPLISFSFAFMTVLLAGCGEESDRLPVDGRDFDGVEYSEAAPYEGRVIDGYLRNARVWLDMDGDGQPTPGPLAITLANGAIHTLENGEPTAMTGPGGHFELDISPLAVNEQVGADLDPRDYPLYALALPGKTQEETSAGEIPVPRAYLMSASPGVSQVTPLSTIARYRALAAERNAPASVTVNPRDYAELDGLNLLEDYVLAGNHRAHAYARALARFSASQMPDSYNDALSQPDADGRVQLLSEDAIFLLGVSLVQNAGAVIETVNNAVVAGDYASVDTDSLVLPDVPLETENPTLVTTVDVFAYADGGGELPVGDSSLEASARLHFDYTAGGRLLSITSQGCLAPDTTELVRLIEADGFMARLNSQWLPAVVLSEQSYARFEEGGLHERWVFDWDNQTAHFDTATHCHAARGVSPDSSELDGTPEIRWSWSLEEGQVVSVEEVINGPAADHTYEPVPAESPAVKLSVPGGAPGFRRSDTAGGTESLLFTPSDQACPPQGTEQDPLDEAGQYITRTFPFTYTAATPFPEALEPLFYEYDVRAYDGLDGAVQRLLRKPFMAPELAALANVDSDDSAFEWLFYYPRLDDAALINDQPNLIDAAFLLDAGTAATCGLAFQARPRSSFARLEYGYQTLSEYLVGLIGE